MDQGVLLIVIALAVFCLCVVCILASVGISKNTKEEEEEEEEEDEVTQVIYIEEEEEEDVSSSQISSPKVSAPIEIPQVSDTPMVCHKIPSVLNSMGNCTGNPLTGGTNCPVTCAEGYELEGVAQFTCNQDGTLQTPHPKCIEKTPQVPDTPMVCNIPDVLNSMGNSTEIY